MFFQSYHIGRQVPHTVCNYLRNKYAFIGNVVKWNVHAQSNTLWATNVSDYRDCWRTEWLLAYCSTVTASWKKVTLRRMPDTLRRMPDTIVDSQIREVQDYRGSTVHIYVHMYVYHSIVKSYARTKNHIVEQSNIRQSTVCMYTHKQGIRTYVHTYLPLKTVSLDSPSR